MNKLWFGLCWVVACSADAGEPRVQWDADAAVRDTSEDTAPPGPPAFCAQQGDDAVRDVVCGDAPLALTSLDELLVALTLKPPPEQVDGSDASSDRTLYSVAVLSHSLALSGRLVSPINPRVIVMGTESFLAFQRGKQQVEVIARQRTEGGLNFYLFDFEQACNAQREGCGNGELYTPQIEANWLRVRVRDGIELANTPEDCRVCHQRGTETASLLMRELEDPWTHFFLPPGPSGVPGVSGADLHRDYVETKGEEPYGGFALHRISDMAPFFLEGLAGPTQPLFFDAPGIVFERHPWGPDGYATEPQPSATWERAYEAWKRGEQLPLPYVDARASDEDKQAALSDAYRRYLAQELDARDLPDLSDIFPDDPAQRARRGLQTEPDAAPEDALIQACGSCHNDVLDQSISRARFNIRVSALDRRELDRAIDRLQRASDERGAMPPRDARELDADARARLIEYLRGDPTDMDREGKLDHAAREGMLGGGGSRRSAGNL
jgi:cytochrome c553